MSKAKQLPINLDAEKSVLGAIYLEPEVYFNISDRLVAEDFYAEKHRLLYSAMGNLATKGQLDLVTLNAELERRGILKNVGGIEYIVEIVNFTPTSEGVKEYAKIVKECSVRRKMINGYSKALNELYDPTKSINSVTDFVQGEVMGGSEKPRNVKNFADAYCEFIEELDRRQRSGEKLPGIQTGFGIFDYMTGGLERGKLYVLGGRPSMGKTAFALNMAVNIAKTNKTVLFFSLEMKTYEVTKRIMSYISGVKSGRLKTASVSDDEIVKMVHFAEKILPEAILIDDSSYQTIGTILSTCIRVNNQLKASGRRIDCVMIDHLHLMSTSGKSYDRRLQIGEISRGSKLLADKMNCPVVLLSQLSRGARERKDNRPILSDLRESGDIEQDADVVAFIHREEYYNPTAENRERAELILAKVRDGEVGKIDLGWDKTTTTFFACP